MKIDVSSYLYNKTKTKDGVNHEVMPEQYIGYNVLISGDYTNCKTKKDVLKKVVKDLRLLANDLEENQINSKKLVRKK